MNFPGVVVKAQRDIHTSVPFLSDFLLALYLQHVDRRIKADSKGKYKIARFFNELFVPVFPWQDENSERMLQAIEDFDYEERKPT